MTGGAASLGQSDSKVYALDSCPVFRGKGTDHLGTGANVWPDGQADLCLFPGHSQCSAGHPRGGEGQAPPPTSLFDGGQGRLLPDEKRQLGGVEFVP